MKTTISSREKELTVVTIENKANLQPIERFGENLNPPKGLSINYNNFLDAFMAKLRKPMKWMLQKANLRELQNWGRNLQWSANYLGLREL